jgi:hypothetical protein
LHDSEASKINGFSRRISLGFSVQAGIGLSEASGAHMSSCKAVGRARRLNNAAHGGGGRLDHRRDQNGAGQVLGFAGRLDPAWRVRSAVRQFIRARAGSARLDQPGDIGVGRLGGQNFCALA